jgi:hypothetical protein
MIKRTFLELIQKRLKSIGETNQFGLQYIETVVDDYWQKFAMNYVSRSGQDASFYTKSYNVTSVSTDSNGLFYVDLPDNIIRYPNIVYSTGSEGVVAIYALSADQWDIKPIREAEYYLIKNLEVYLAASEHYYWVGYDKIYFSDNITAEIQTNGVRLNLMVPFTSYAYTEYLPLPNDMDQKLSDYVVSFLAGTPIPDLHNNNSDE